MENIAEDSRKALKLATEIKNMLNGTMENIAEDSRKALILATEIKNMLNGYGHLPRECKQIKVSGLQTVYPDGNCNKEVSVQCEEGGWTVIQKRCNGAVEFNRNWNDYENGFGDLHGEFWLGNKNIAQLTSEGNHELMIDVEDWDGNTRYAVYRSFSIGDASTNYRLNISDYSGNAGDGMTFLNGMKFTTYDQDNDLHDSINCANHPTFKGGWWYHGCWTHKEAMLNGHYTSKNSSHQGIIYRTIGKYSQKKSTMKIRRL
ncbi:Fibrinogen-like protein 1,Fibrinogen-like protein A,Angiopoietin-4,Tenascin,Ryncolin-2,Angiopoietin-related protein 6,Fibrinogen C domain-containing protein 1-A,Angiopoietin-related protein 2,Microfibril-associated glycoprotein 4,Angiopoietin-related protein 1,Ficolin-2,Tenascin-R,Ryncolin-3,Ficolin-1,Fibroleukin,Fibrinogen C domain-containing protein 1 [Mytilus coruscus]|uniref:Fibrinogen C-terminal domain-containing protein n=1 Tax=Mytilus coruscus TaxID=42192 RepID=A0A6J8C2U4_MYTCO|nr:Fibrinogen-like protein 1,Fibrinogen-like protein A,Angiopoietin-4,Tenascin,Ryncolin-2,Angiopoietin-related protein 6,Fibrinogen C domain-containing protein 1-A,Angiopoietin-related protein 2,Microfibril-associated glycoprotein 4,Angiopoietin-related protein 1,Ficolin-2,Tenascin-R,Ryncolin-3,Ficolin-1,Fibroleukin,Fibrinogen C domain-containing protein 1 [Mytilus coruscus]